MTAHPRRLPAEPARPAGGGVDPHLPRGRGRVREAGPDVLRRQGLHRDAAAGGEGVLPGEDPVPGAAGRHRLRLPRGARDPRQLGQPPRRPPDRGQRRGGHRQRRRRRRRQDQPQPAPDRHPAQRHRGGRLHRRLRWRPPRRGEGPRQGARLLPPRRVRPVGPEDAAPRAVEPLQRPDPRRRAHADLPAVQLDRARHLALHRPRGDRDPLDLLLPPAPRLRARRHAAHRESELNPLRHGETVEETHRPLPHRRRPDPDRLRGVPTPPPSTRSSTRSPSPGSPSAAPPAATTGSPRRPWRTARRRATSDGRDRTDTESRRRLRDGPAPLRHRRLRRRRQVDPDRPAAARLQVDLRGPARGRRGDQRRPRATTTPTSRC